MSLLAPIDTPAQREELAWSNRRVIAERTGWPAGALEECERLSREYPGWWVCWAGENTGSPDWARPAGFFAYRPGCRAEWPLFATTAADLEDLINPSRQRDRVRE